MGWIPYPTALNGYGSTGQGQASASSLPYTAQQLDDPRVPQSIRDQMANAQAMQAAATSMAPHTSTLATGLQGLAGFLGGRQEAQASAAAAPYQAQASPSGQPSASLLGNLLRGGSGNNDSSMPPTSGWGAVGQAAGQAAQQIGRKSDRRLKSDVVRIGALPNGLAVYRYRLQGGPPEIGLMAQEVMALRPEAVWEAADGFLRVRYDLAVL